MDYDPISEVIDEALAASEAGVLQLQAFRARDKFTELPGVDTTEACD
jgi:hypothetical protein